MAAFMGAIMDGWATSIVTESFQSFGGFVGMTLIACFSWINQLDEQLNYWAGEQQADLQSLHVHFHCGFTGDMCPLWQSMAEYLDGFVFVLWFTPAKATFIHDETYMWLAPEVSFLGAPPPTNETNSQYEANDLVFLSVYMSVMIWWSVDCGFTGDMHELPCCCVFLRWESDNQLSHGKKKQVQICYIVCVSFLVTFFCRCVCVWDWS